jgi:hypothetical protein
MNSCNFTALQPVNSPWPRTLPKICKACIYHRTVPFRWQPWFTSLAAAPDPRCTLCRWTLTFSPDGAAQGLVDPAVPAPTNLDFTECDAVRKSLFYCQSAPNVTYASLPAVGVFSQPRFGHGGWRARLTWIADDSGRSLTLDSVFCVTRPMGVLPTLTAPAAASSQTQVST